MSSKNRSLLWITAILALSGLVATVGLGWLARQQHQELASRFNAVTDETTQAIKDRIETYEYGLRGVRGIFVVAGEDGISRQEFRRYADSREHQREFPGSRGFGFIQRVPKASEARFLQAARADGKPDFSIRQLTPHEGERMVIKYIEPEADNSQAVGLDIASESNRREAALTAIREARSILTGPITLVQAEGKPNYGFLLLLPTYRTGADVSTPQARMQAADGLVYTPLLMDEILAGQGGGFQDVSLAIYDTEQDQASKPFFTSPAKTLSTDTSLTQRVKVSLYGREWWVQVTATQHFVDRLNFVDSRKIVGTLALTALLACLVLLNYRQRQKTNAQLAKLTSIVGSTTEAIISKDLNGVVTSWNHAAEHIFGYTAAEAIGRTVTDLIIPPSLSQQEGVLLARVAAGEATQNTVCVRQRKDGTLIDTSVSVAPIFSANGTVVGATSVMSDITEQMRDQARLQLAVDSAGVGTWLWNLADNSLLWDDHMCKMYATPGTLRKSERYYEHWASTVHPDDLADAEKKLQDHLAGTGVYDTVFRIVLPNGEIRWIQASAVVKRDHAGQATEMLGINWDITEHKQKEMHILALNAALEARSQELTQSANLLRNVLRAASEVAIIAVDTAGTTLLFNSGAERLLGHRSDEFVGKPLPISLFRPEDVASAQQALVEKLGREVNGGELLPHTAQLDEVNAREFTCVHHNGTPVPVWLMVTPMQDDDGTLIGYVFVAQDISEQKKAGQELTKAKEMAESANRAKADFLANMSHEIRTPMNAILGLAYLLQKQALSDDSRRMVEKIHASGQALIGVINDILDFSKIEARRLEIEQVPFRLADVLDNVATIMSSLVGTKPIEATVSAPPQGANFLVGDSLRLGQVLINLASNAIKFTERGEVSLHVVAEAPPSDTLAVLRFSITDTGPGISLDKQVEIFRAFSQEDTSTTRNHGGTGLGLTISSQLVELMGGKLTVVSAPGNGSEFSFSLSFALSSAADHPSHSMTHQRILIADDNDTARTVLSDTVQSLGWHADAVDSGEKVIDWVTEQTPQPYDILLLDWRMPGINGLQAASAIREKFSDHAAPIIVMVTAFDRDRLAREPGSECVDVVLSKPVTGSSLYDAVIHAKQIKGLLDIGSTPSGNRRLAGLKILVVDDSEINRDVAARILEDEGAHVALAEDGRLALALLQDQPARFDVVLMDMQMPVMDGYTATRQMRATPELASMPVIALTAGAYKAQQNLALEAGVNVFVAKPFDVDTLIQAILRLLPEFVPTTAPVAKQLPEPARTEGPLDRAWALRAWKTPDNYHQALLKFARTHGADVEKIRLAPLATAAAMAHKLKGTSGQLGMPAVAQWAGEVERCLKDGSDAGHGLDELDSAMTGVLAAIAQEAPPLATLAAPLSGEADPKIQAQHLAKLMHVLDTDDISSIEPVIEELAGTLPATQLEGVRDAVTNYNFREAEQLVSYMVEELAKRGG